MCEPSLCVALGGASSAACVTIGGLDPKPRVDLAPTGKALSLKLDEGVGDSSDLDLQDGRANPVVPATARLRGWRASLAAGFRNAFGAAFDVSDRRPADVTLELVSTEMPQLALGPNRSVAVIHYDARLLDPSGRSLKRLSSTVQSYQAAAITAEDQMCRTFAEAIGAMYEKIAAQFFKGEASSGSADRRPATP